ncbi:MAG: hypothetical protein ACI8W8_001724 [Rhodothermales bacterium]|jgi:hypothetical protein
MATSFFRNKNNTRPRKSAAEREKRVAKQRERLVELGGPADAVAKLNTKEVRTLLRRPARVVQYFNGRK